IEKATDRIQLVERQVSIVATGASQRGRDRVVPEAPGRQPAQLGFLVGERAAKPGASERQAGVHEGSLMRETHVVPGIVGCAELVAAQPGIRRGHTRYVDGGRRVQLAGEYSGA